MLCIPLLINTPATAQSLVYPLGARAKAMGECGLTQADPYGIFNNQAVLARLQNAGLLLCTENRYLLPDMNRVSLGAVIPAGSGMLLSGLDHFGGPLYSEMCAGAGYALPIGQYVAAGLRLDYLRISFGEGYSSRQAISFEGGLLITPGPKLSLGMHIFNPLHLKWIGTDEPLPTAFRAGASYRPEPQLIFALEIHSSNTTKAVFCGGAEYRFQKKFFIRAGISSGDARYSFGAGLRLKRLSIDIASSIHAWLAYSPLVSFTYSFEK